MGDFYVYSYWPNLTAAMNKIILYATLTIIVAALCGCPYYSPYSIDKEPQQNIDETLIGKWAMFVTKPGDDKQLKEEPVKIIFDKKNDREYTITLTGYIDELRPYHVVVDDSVKGTAFISSVLGKQFLNVFIYRRVFVAEIKNENKVLSILFLAENFTSKFVKNSLGLRTALGFHYKTRVTPSYDEYFLMKNLQKVN